MVLMHPGRDRRQMDKFMSVSKRILVVVVVVVVDVNLCQQLRCAHHNKLQNEALRTRDYAILLCGAATILRRLAAMLAQPRVFLMYGVQLWVTHWLSGLIDRDQECKMQQMC